MRIYSGARLGALVLAMLGLLQTAAFADAIEGRVVKATPSRLDVTVYDRNGRPFPNSLPIKVNLKTRLSGIKKITDLKRNDAVGADVRQEESGAWVADRVTRFQQVNARPATQNPPPTMRDFLGQPVVRGALTGAATGALASGLSGGKAGKGALVGAGVGAAAGLLEGLFSQPSSQSSGQYSSDTSNQ